MPAGTGGEASDGDGPDPDDEASAESEPDVVLPKYDAVSGTVTSSATGEKLGRISLIKEKTKGEAVSVYCRRHGCSIMVGSKHAPALLDVLKWYAAGEDITKSRERAVMLSHKRLFSK